MKQSQMDADSAKVKTEAVKTHPSHPLKDYTGLFNHKGYGTMDIYLEHDSLFLRIGKNIAWIKPDKYDWFKIYRRDKEGRIDTMQGFDIEFRTAPNGEINELDASFEPSVKTLGFYQNTQSSQGTIG